MRNNLPKQCPQELIELGNQRWLELQSHAQFSVYFEALEDQIKTAFSLSEFISEQCLKSPVWLTELLVEKQLFAEQIDYQNKLALLLVDTDSEAGLQKNLRQFRNFHMLRIAWRDLPFL